MSDPARLLGRKFNLAGYIPKHKAEFPQSGVPDRATQPKAQFTYNSFIIASDWPLNLVYQGPALF